MVKAEILNSAEIILFHGLSLFLAYSSSMAEYRGIFFKIEKFGSQSLGIGANKQKRKKDTPDLGLEPRALRLKVSRADQLCQPGEHCISCNAILIFYMT
jgi:hypothetical protein